MKRRDFIKLSAGLGAILLLPRVAAFLGVVLQDVPWFTLTVGVAALVVALDRFMAERLVSRAKLHDKLVVIPPWPHEQAIEPVPHTDNPFRQRLGLQDKFVVMYSGNHSPSNPLTTVLDAAVRLKNDPSIRFLFIGGGIARAGKALFEPLEKFLEPMEWRPGGHRAKILPAQLGEFAGAFGAASSALKFSP